MKQIKLLPKSLQNQVSANDAVTSLSSDDVSNHISKLTKNYLYDRLCFRSENYIANLDTSYEKFDTILCLGTVKWIHLNFGDSGVKALFHKVYEQLESGGIFIMEQQPWKGYKKKKNLSPDLQKTYVDIKLRPNNFSLYLTQSVGFEFMKKLECSEKILDFSKS